jgi:predicted amidohydrolase YtcJ
VLEQGIVEETPAIYRAGRVITQAGTEAEAFAVWRGRVLATGPLAALRERYAGAEVVDFGDATVVPGFHDAHIHLAMAAEDMLHLDLSATAVSTLAELTRVVGEEARRTPPGGWVRGSRYDDVKMPEGRVLTRWDLDEVAPDVPVLVLHVAGHWGVVNSRALELADIDDDTRPPAGGDFGRDGSGRHNGVLYEQALFDFAYGSVSKTGRTIVPVSTPEDRLTGLRRAVERWHAAGLTSICDALVGPADLRLFQAARERGLLTLRTGMLLAAEHYNLVHELGFGPGFGDEWLRFVGVKTFVDGAIGGRTCLLEEPAAGVRGIQTTATDDLGDIVRTVHGDGNRICVHANGDRAIRILLDQLEKAHDADPRPGLSHRIEHCSLVDDDILRRMRAIGAIAVPFGSYVHYHGGALLDWYGPERMSRMFAHRSFLDAGVPVAGSSDFPCGPYEPLLALQSMVTRRGFDGVAVAPEQRITPAEALALYTTGAATATGEDGVKGRLAPGYLADFVVLADDPLTCAPERIADVGVRATYVGGSPVFTATP